MLKGFFLGIALATIVVGVAWVIVVGVSQAPETKEVYVPYPVTIVDQSNAVQVEQLKAENANLNRQLITARDDLSICQQRIDYENSADYDQYRYDTYYGSDGVWDLTVRVRDDDTGDPIEDARVRVENGDTDSDYTDEDGEAFFSNLEEDCYDIEITADGYEDENDDFCLEDDERITIRMFYD
jgi:hypothetical protein